MRRLLAIVVLLLGAAASFAQDHRFVYYAAINGAQAGPFTEGELSAQIAAGTVGPDTLVWHVGMADWAPAQSVGDLAAAFAPPPLPGAPPPLPADPVAPAADAQREAVEKAVTLMFEAEGSAAAHPAQLATLIACHTDMAMTFSPAEQQVLIDANGHPPQEEMIAISKAHPEMEAMQQACSMKAQLAK